MITDPRIVRRVVNRLAEIVMLAAGPVDVDFIRASGDVCCGGCGQSYRVHPHDPYARWLNVLCDGQRVKL